MAAKKRKRRYPITSPAIKPGTYTEWLHNHPEECDRILREFGVDIEELDRILENGGGVLPVSFGPENHPLKKKARGESASTRNR